MNQTEMALTLLRVFDHPSTPTVVSLRAPHHYTLLHGTMCYGLSLTSGITVTVIAHRGIPMVLNTFTWDKHCYINKNYTDETTWIESVVSLLQHIKAL